MPSVCVASCAASLTLPRLISSAPRMRRSTWSSPPSSWLQWGSTFPRLIETLQGQNAIQPSGTVDAGAEKIAIRVSGQFMSEEGLKAVNFRVNGRFFRLSDIANVRRTYVDPEQPMFRYNGTPAIGLAISMTKNANVLQFGEHIKERLAKPDRDPAGRHRVASRRGPAARRRGGRR